MKHTPIKNMHWAAKYTVKFGTLFALCVLCCGFIPSQGSFFARSLCKTAVYMFALSVIGGLLMDVIAKRTGAE